MSDVEQRLANVYGATSVSELSKTYDDWAAHYDSDMLSVGYAHPATMVGLVARYLIDLNAPILDAGVGTGTIGTLLHILNYTNLHGIDMSQGMLAQAKARGVYRALGQAVLGEALDFASGQFSCIISTGTFTTGHAPASAFDELTRLLTPGGILIFTVGEAFWAQAGFAQKLAGLCAQGRLRPVWATEPYRPMPHSKTESHFLARAHVYQRV